MCICNIHGIWFCEPFESKLPVSGHSIPKYFRAHLWRIEAFVSTPSYRWRKRGLVSELGICGKVGFGCFDDQWQGPLDKGHGWVQPQMHFIILTPSFGGETASRSESCRKGRLERAGTRRHVFWSFLPCSPPHSSSWHGAKLRTRQSRFLHRGTFKAASVRKASWMVPFCVGFQGVASLNPASSPGRSRFKQVEKQR